MTTDHQQLAERYLAMLNQHDPDAVDGFVAAGYINHNPQLGVIPALDLAAPQATS